MMSLGGLALGIGMILDSSIVVLENIFRHREEGKGVIEGALEGSHEVGMAITASTLTTICVFLPLLFLKGIEGVIFNRKDVDGTPLGFSDAAIAESLGVTKREYLAAKAKMIQHEKIEISEKGAIKILNWSKYQSEYQRQRPYRRDTRGNGE
ncbi:Multidrug resistance protein MdtC [subsurface metagenome]